MTIRYTATIKGGSWLEVGDRILPGKEPVRFFEMNLKRIGDTTWPAAGRCSPSRPVPAQVPPCPSTSELSPAPPRARRSATGRSAAKARSSWARTIIPKVSMHTHSLAQYVKPLDRGDWQGVGELMLSSADKLAKGGADFLDLP